MFETPILFIVFNRLDTAKQVFAKIKEIKPSRLYIAADGPRTDRPNEKEKCEAVRKYLLEAVDWDCKVTTLFRDANLGCKYAVSGAIKWFFSQEEMGIVLEDDCLPCNSFFSYCQTLLAFYKNDDKIGMISGHNYFGTIKDRKNDYSIITTCGVWGWASWSRVINGYDPDRSSFKAIEEKKEINSICYNKNVAYEIIKNSYKAAINELNTWDYQFCEYLITNGFYTVMPNRNQIRNIGFICDSTHTAAPPRWYIDRGFEYDHDVKTNGYLTCDESVSKRVEGLFQHKKEKMRFFKKAIRKIVRVLKT